MTPEPRHAHHPASGRHEPASGRHEPAPGRREVSDRDYRALAELRHGQRQFLHWSGEQATRVGITPTQHQLLLGIRGWAQDGPGPTITDIAEFMLLRHHSAVELVDRAERAGLVARRRDDGGGGHVIVRITERGAERLHRLTETHLRELAELAPMMSTLWDAVADITRGPADGSGA